MSEMQSLKSYDRQVEQQGSRVMFTGKANKKKGTTLKSRISHLRHEVEWNYV